MDADTTQPASILRAVLITAALLTCSLFGPAVASAACGRTTLDTSTQQLVSGEAVRLGGTTCGSSVRIMIGREEHWELLSTLHAGADGRFAKRVRLGVPRDVSSVDLRAASSHGLSRRIRVQIEHPAPEPAAPAPTPAHQPASTPASTPAPEAAPVPEPTPAPEPTPPAPEPGPTPEVPPTPTPGPTPAPEACPLGATATSAPVGMSLPGCKLIASDTSSESNPLGFWKFLACQESSRYATVSSDGDTHPTATGAPQENSAYRRLTVFDGDDIWGERCELGENDHRTGSTTFYHQGDHRVTYLSERLPSSNYPLSNPNWQTVMQMKQAQPADGGGEGPQLEMQAREGKWFIVNAWNTLWTFPAQADKWTRFAWDVYYSQDPNQGWLQVSADLNGDGDFNDPGERSPVIHAATLKTEIPGPNGTSDGLAPGDPIPSHLRVGIYHNPSISCPAPSGCSAEVDNVQVVGP